MIKNPISERKAVISGPVHQIRQAALRRNRRHRRWSLQERATFQVQGMHSFEDAKITNKEEGHWSETWQRCGRQRRGAAQPRGVHLRQLEREPKTSKQGNSVHSGPNKKITDSVKDGPFSNQTGSISNVKSGPKMKYNSKKAPHVGSITDHLMIPRYFRSTTKGHLQCMQDPSFIHRPNNKGKLPGSWEAPIYHEPGTVSCKTVEDLKKLYPNSFYRLGSLKGAYNIRIDPTVKPVTHARRKVPIESKETIDKELDYLIEEEIITEQVEPTPWVSSVTFPRKPKRGRKGMSGSKQLEQGHHQRAP